MKDKQIMGNGVENCNAKPVFKNKTLNGSGKYQAVIQCNYWIFIIIIRVIIAAFCLWFIISE